MKPSVGAKSDVGRVRDGNEDSYLVQEPFFAVADGMGGHLAGDVASRMAVQTITEHTRKGAGIGPEGLERAVKSANAAIHGKASSDPALHGMGTTCTLLLVGETDAHIAHVGDSRAYLLHEGELSQVTEDHTLVGRMVKEGRLKPEEAERHPQRSIITRALGVDDEVEVDLLTIPIQEGDKVLLCSDGLTSMIDSAAIHRALTENEDPQDAVEALIDLANEAGGEDNITAVLLAFDGGGGGMVAHSAESSTLTQEVAAAEVARRQETVQPGASREDMTGAFKTPPVPTAAPRSKRRSRPVLATLLLLAVVLGAAALAFKYLIVDSSYYVTVNEAGHVAIYQGLPDEVLGMTFQDEIETSEVMAGDLPDFLREDVEDGIEAESLEGARSTLSNLEDRARDEEFQRDQKSTKGGGGG